MNGNIFIFSEDCCFIGIIEDYLLFTPVSALFLMYLESMGSKGVGKDI
jgi:hypothetical protein